MKVQRFFSLVIEIIKIISLSSDNFKGELYPVLFLPPSKTSSHVWKSKR